MISLQRVPADRLQKDRRVIHFPANFPFFRIIEKPTTKHPKENFLNLEEDLQEGLLN